MSESESRDVDLFGESVSYEVRRSDEATKPRIDVDIRGVTVVLPEGSDESPETLLTENAAWVVGKKKKYDTYREQVPERRFVEGELFPYLGDSHEVVIEQRPASEVSDGKLCLAEHHVEQTSVKRVLETLYRRKARERFEKRADYFAEKMEVEYEKIEIRNQRTKWGSCSTTGTVGLNWRLMMAPPDVIDSIIVHELAHLIEQNHTQRFRDIVEEHDPEYEIHAEWLEKNSARLVFSRDDL